MLHNHKIHAVGDFIRVESAFHFGAGVLKNVGAIFFDKVGAGLHAVKLDEVTCGRDPEAVEVVGN
jgi:hypothetical protein